nr:hypothetical protein [Mycobacterium pseudokansasii]
MTRAANGGADTLVAEAENDDGAATGQDPHCDDSTQPPAGVAQRRVNGGVRWSRVVPYGLLPGVALVLAMGLGMLKWQNTSALDAAQARTESVRAATDGTIALLSYRPGTVQAELEAARSKLTGSFLQAYTSLTHDVVIPGAKQKQISAVATVPAAASTSATSTRAVVLLFVNQTVVVGQNPPSSTTSTVRVTLDKVDGKWLISQFDPV